MSDHVKLHATEGEMLRDLSKTQDIMLKIIKNLTIRIQLLEETRKKHLTNQRLRSINDLGDRDERQNSDK